MITNEERGEVATPRCNNIANHNSVDNYKQKLPTEMNAGTTGNESKIGASQTQWSHSAATYTPPTNPTPWRRKRSLRTSLRTSLNFTELQPGLNPSNPMPQPASNTRTRRPSLAACCLMVAFKALRYTSKRSKSVIMRKWYGKIGRVALNLLLVGACTHIGASTDMGLCCIIRKVNLGVMETSTSMTSPGKRA